MPGAPMGANTGSPAAPAARYNTMLATPATGPSIRPASTTIIGCSVIGTGVNGSGIATCDAAARASAKPATAAMVRPTPRGCSMDLERVLMVTKSEFKCCSIDALDAPGDGVPTAEAERCQASTGARVAHRVKWRGGEAGAARADRVPQRDGAAVDVHPAPVPPELLTVGERLGRERLVRLDEVVVADRGARLPHEIADGEDRGEEEIFGVGGAGGVAGDAGEDRQA